MEKIISWCDRISQAGGVMSGILMVFSVGLVLAEIIVRTIFNTTLFITEEYSGYLMAAMTFLALAFTLKDKSHIRMVFLHTVLKGKARVALDIYAFAVGFIFCAVLTWTTSLFFWDSLVNNSRSMQISETYLAIPQFFMPLGTLLMTIQFFAEMCRSIIRLRSGETESETESSALGR